MQNLTLLNRWQGANATLSGFSVSHLGLSLRVDRGWHPGHLSIGFVETHYICLPTQWENCFFEVMPDGSDCVLWDRAAGAEIHASTPGFSENRKTKADWSGPRGEVLINSVPLKHWQGDQVRLWHYTVRDKTLCIRIERLGTKENLQLYCAGTSFLCGLTQWDYCNLELLPQPEGYLLRDLAAGFEVHTMVIEYLENSEPIWKSFKGVSDTTLYSGDSADEVFYRVSNRHRPETADNLDRQSKQAVAHPDFAVHGISIRTADNLQDLHSFPSATRSAIEAHFSIRKTGPQPWHYTVELPDPITQEAADTFNRIFGKL